MASTYLTRTTEAGTSYNKFTFSFWGKISELSSNSRTYFSEYYNSSNYTHWHIRGSDHDFQLYGNEGGNTEYNLQTNRKFRDVNAWYHFVVAFDSTQSTASDRISKSYKNDEPICVTNSSSDKLEGTEFCIVNSDIDSDTF